MTTLPLDDPSSWFDLWMQEAIAAGIHEPNAMTLATLDSQGQPSLRVVLLKGHDPEGFVFYTNSLSRKGQDMAHNPRVALNFFWPSLARQVRVEAQVTPVSSAEADAYFASRPRLSQLGAWASLQSQALENRQTLEERTAQFDAQFGLGPIPRPPHWWGYRAKPSALEFWIAGEGRLHDRWRFTRQGHDQPWQCQRLFP